MGATYGRTHDAIKLYRLVEAASCLGAALSLDRVALPFHFDAEYGVLTCGPLPNPNSRHYPPDMSCTGISRGDRRALDGLFLA